MSYEKYYRNNKKQEEVENKTTVLNQGYYTIIVNKQENWRFQWNTLHLCKSCIIVQNLAGHMQVNKSNKSYYLSDDTVIVPDDSRSTVKSYDWRSSTSCYDGWLRPQHICKIGKVFKGDK